MQVAKFTRRFKDEDDEYQNTCEFFSHIVDLAIYSIPQDRAGPFEAMYHVVDDTRRFYSIREVHRIVIGSVKSHFLFFFVAGPRVCRVCEQSREQKTSWTIRCSCGMLNQNVFFATHADSDFHDLSLETTAQLQILPLLHELFRHQRRVISNFGTN